MSYHGQGRKEVAEAVIIAALSALVSSLANWAIDVARKKAEAAAAKPDEKKQ